MAITRSAKATLGSKPVATPAKIAPCSTQAAPRPTTGAARVSKPAANPAAKPLRTAASEGFPMHKFADAAAFDAYMAAHHASAPGVYIQLAKKASGVPSISAAEAIEVVLCYGWIDGGGHSIDDRWWTTRYVPRRPRSLWSKKNVATVGRLIEQGRMTPAGLAEVDAAKADGRWARAYSGPATMVVPKDLEEKLQEEGSEAARELFEGLNKTDRYAVLWRIETTRTDATRRRKIEELVEKLGDGQIPGKDARAKYQTKRK